ncbi:unnamed protein product, partial [Linum tenue]
MCEAPCDWYIWASKLRDEDVVKITRCKLEHTADCTLTFNNRFATYKFLGDKMTKKVAADHSMSKKLLKQIVKEDYREEIGDMKAWRIKKTAIEKVCGSIRDQYESLYHYAAELRRSNPNSTVVVEQREQVFNRMYVCFEASMKGFRAGCRQVICIDGCFLKHDYGGQLLSAVGIDANEQYFPIAFAYVEVENKDNWLWFLELLGTDLHINDNHGWTFISDKQNVHFLLILAALNLFAAAVIFFFFFVDK